MPSPPPRQARRTGADGVVPVFNEEVVILAAVRSLLAIDYPALDILIVDDGSTDETFALSRRPCRDSTAVRRCRWCASGTEGSQRMNTASRSPAHRSAVHGRRFASHA